MVQFLQHSKKKMNLTTAMSLNSYKWDEIIPATGWLTISHTWGFPSQL
jgi:hypothetical protein